ncbi:MULTISPECIES: flagellar hook-basal body protein [Paenibacillus]|uniref:flagellar hook-basal body protein n=1 Tax=Paenibacillus TaxID=44249 RepID=UPI0022B8ED80|nr:flagellar hook-basal body protein [Paenibacillus caseinilyticus]MCZ8523335.1 flagellar hook-basal body protein [Paenibacillus caseinilyticus]
MNNSMINSSVSMHSLQQKLDLVANNIANVNTTGYKRREASFQDVLTSVKEQPKNFEKTGRLTPLGYGQGWGAKMVAAQLNLAQGSLQTTDNPLDTAIEGSGLFEISTNGQDETGNATTTTRWTRNGAFELSKSTDPADPRAFLTTKDGHYVMGADNQPIRIPEGRRVQIEANGVIMAYNDAQPAEAPVQAGQLKMVRVVRPQLLEQIGDNLYGLPGNITQQQRDEILQTVTAANNAVDPITVRQGFLEQSNVNLSDEMTEMLTVQRAFQLNSRAISSADQMMNLANNLRA